VPNFHPTAVQNLAQLGINGTPGASITLLHPHMDDIQWSGGNSYGFITANAISFGSDLLTRKCQIFIRLQ
jgi:hypothetical protein